MSDELKKIHDPLQEFGVLNNGLQHHALHSKEQRPPCFRI
ncbi:hypothetical protein HAL013_05320 [Helicobacter ailurogastricus]|uniref:Uncharacterized protein n=1 Tax=Helicobacter ailurogastricus TaxID=1578720 RepID=A0A0K2X5X3_9HELI|nr:hypothetical protein HAL011_07390 [Helicobacter ailurogastricus]CRF42362.1 hypothetical protein HAL013_05320 [Helicobacter ailurogastricus]